MSVIGDARTALFDALAPVFVDPIDGWTFAGRIHRTKPADLIAPSVYIGASTGRDVTGQAPAYVVTFPVHVAYDGANQSQVDGLEEIISRVHDAALAVGKPVSHDNTEVLTRRAGTASTLAAAVIDVDVTVRARTFCIPSPVQEAASV